MKYFNKTRTTEEKSNQREIMIELKKQTEILTQILQKLEK